MITYATLDSNIDISEASLLGERYSLDETIRLIKYYATERNVRILDGLVDVITYEEALALTHTPAWTPPGPQL